MHCHSNEPVLTNNDDGDECKDCDGTGGGEINWEADDIEDICDPEVF